MANFLVWWQELPYWIDPIAFNAFGFPVRYYGISYLFAFATTYVLVIYRTKREIRFSSYGFYVQELMISAAFGVFIGGRLGYIVFYNFEYFFSRPLEIILPLDTLNNYSFIGFSGMSYHGGLLGSLVVVYIFAIRKKLDFFEITGLFVPAVPLGYTFGRLGNFVNGELYGRETSFPIGMYFPADYSSSLRHPSQLYEAFFEGIILFVILWSLKNKFSVKGSELWFYLMGYGTFRFIIECFREPDSHIGFVFLSLSMGQLLSILMVLVGGSMFLWFSDDKLHV